MSKPIGDLTLKAAPAGADMIAIADSQDSNKTKKILVSAISGGGGGGGSDMIHVLDDTVTWANPTYSATGTGITQYEDGHFYLIKFPSISGSISQNRKLNINNLGEKNLSYNYFSDWLNDSVSQSNLLPETPATCVLLYRSSTNTFYLIDSTNHTYKDRIYLYEGHLYTAYYGRNVVPQEVSSQYNSTVSVNISANTSCHKLYDCTVAVTSLTIIATNRSSWETEVHFTTGATFSLNLSGSNFKWLGDAAPTFEPNTSYVIAIKNGYGVCSKVVP